MKSYILNSPGAPENLQLVDRPVPVPGDSEILVQVKAFGLNRSEIMTRKGYSPDVKFPRVLGIECNGIVAQDPQDKLKPGTQVAAMMGGMGRDFDGSYQESLLCCRAISYTLLKAILAGMCWVPYPKYSIPYRVH